jgi:hypothetical protein
MATVITWNISRLDCVPQTPEGADYVITAHWQCNGVDENYSGSVYGTTGFSVLPNPDFIPYADLTQDQVLGWVWASGVDKASTKTRPKLRSSSRFKTRSTRRLLAHRCPGAHDDGRANVVQFVGSFGRISWRVGAEQHFPVDQRARPRCSEYATDVRNPCRLSSRHRRNQICAKPYI